MASAGGSDFVHLHAHTEYSMLDGAARLGDLFAEVERLGQTAIATTDHGYLFGAFDFWSKATAAGIKPIIGVEAYVTPGTSRFDQTRVRFGQQGQEQDDVSARGAYTHMTLLARNNEGLHNLMRASSLASLEGQMGKWPRMDRDLLQRYGNGLIATSGCPSGEIQTRLRLGQWDEAVRAAGELQDIFGKEYFYVELMDHGLDIETRVIKDLLRLSETIGAPLLATNDLHYVKREDRESQDALLAINSGSTLADPDRFKFDGDGYYVKSAEEMRRTWAEHPEACDNTLLVAEQCEVTFNTSANYMPNYPVPAGEDETSWFIKEVETGLRFRYPDGIPDEVRKQAEFETEVITGMGFPGYFLVVADFINWAKNNGIRVGPGRGSGAGSMAAYAMRITDLDPLQHGLIFERFLNPDRVSMPDFDVDFDERRRGEVIRYVTDKYGEDRVAQIVTYGTIKAKQALKDSARLLGMPFAMGEKLTKAMPPAIMGKDISLTGIFDPADKRYHEAEEFRQVHAADPEAQRVVELAKGIEGLKRQWGVHAAGVIMSSDPLIDIIPIMRRPQDGAVITQFDYPTSEGLGLIKMDFLGLRNLTILDDALENIVMNGKEPVVLEDLPLDDRATYELLGRGDTLGVFQLDGGGMRSLLRLMRPDNFEDISAVGALYRPGPMGANSHTNYALRKTGAQPVTPIHPELEEPLAEILGTTYGLIVYQEQVMAIAQRVAGYSLGQADILRRAMGKKKKSELDKQFEGFSAGMVERGFSMGAVQTLWDILLPFSDYAFNKAHSAAYGVISYWTAYLKANYSDRVHGRAAHQRPRRQGQVGAVPRRGAAHGDHGPAARRELVLGQLHGRRQGHPLRSDGRAQRRRQRGRRHRAGAGGEGRVHLLHRLPGQGARGRLQQADHRVAHQGRGVRLPRPRSSRAAAGARAGRRLGHRRQAQGGGGSVRPVRRPAGRGRRRSGLRGRGAGPARLGQEAAARVRAGDARAVRLGPPPVRARARARRGGGRLDRHAAGRRAAPGRLDRRRRRPDHVPAAQDVQAGQPVGGRDDRGHGGLGRGHVLRGDVSGLLHGAGRGRRRRHPRPGAPARRDHAAAGHGGVAARRLRGRGRPRGGVDVGLALYAAGGRAAA